VGAKITTAHKAIRDIRKYRSQMEHLKEVIGKEPAFKPLVVLIAQTDSLMTGVEKAIYQTQNRSSQDPLNFPVRLNDKLANLMGLNAADDFPPTQQSLDVREVLFRQTDAQLAQWEQVKTLYIPQINRLVREMGIDVVKVKMD
jgi:hypothetical protein